RAPVFEDNRAGLICPRDSENAALGGIPNSGDVRDSQIPSLNLPFPFVEHNPTFAVRTQSVSIPPGRAIQTLLQYTRNFRSSPSRTTRKYLLTRTRPRRTI